MPRTNETQSQTASICFVRQPSICFIKNGQKVQRPTVSLSLETLSLA